RTGITVGGEVPARLRSPLAADAGAEPRVILADRAEKIGSTRGDEARPVIAQALAALGVESRPGITVAAIDAAGAVLATGERIDARTVIWCAGMETSPLTARFPVARDRFGRLPVSATLNVEGLSTQFP